MSKKVFHITAYYFGEEMPTQYPVPLHIEECEVNTNEKVNDFYRKGCKPSSESDGKALFCMRVQEYEKNESGGLMHRDDEIKMGLHPYYTYGCYDDVCLKTFFLEGVATTMANSHSTVAILFLHH